jgi:hypothetical protein
VRVRSGPKFVIQTGVDIVELERSGADFLLSSSEMEKAE